MIRRNHRAHGTGSGATFLALLLAACGSTAPPTSTQSPSPQATPTTNPVVECAPDIGEQSQWNDERSAERSLSFGEHHHSTQGVVTTEGAPIQVHGKFAYGSMSKDLEGEDAVLFIETSACEWNRAGDAVTNDDGRARFEHPPLGAGVYRFRIVVPGDGSFAEGTISVMEAGTPIVIFDIDGTLTVSDGEIFEEALLGTTPEAFEGAAAVVQAYADAGVQPVYVTGRTYHFQGKTDAWLRDQGFPLGPLRTTDSIRDAFPGSQVEEYKLAFIESIRAAGLTIAAAYGNASSDVCAYARAEISPDRTFIVGPNASVGCESFPPPSALSSYVEHLDSIQAL